MLFSCNCVEEKDSYEFVDTSAVHVTVHILIQVVNLIPAWIIDGEFKFGDDFIHLLNIFHFAETFEELSVCSFEWRLKVAALDESERPAASSVIVSMFSEKRYTVRVLSETVLNLKSPSRAVMQNSVSVECMNVVTVTRDWLCEMFLFELQEAL